MTVSVVFLVVLALGHNTYEEATKLPDIRTTGQNSGADKSPGALLATLYKRPDGPVGFDGDEPLLGDSEAPYQIVEFADFGCPHCARAKEEFHQLVQANPDVAVRFRYFPLSGACNPVLPEGGTAERCNAAAAAECAHQQGKFWEMADQLFQNMGYFEPEQLAYMAGELSLDLPKWEACMAAPETMETLARNGRAGGEAGVQGTPAIFLKGVVPGTYVSVTRGPEAVLKLIEAHRDGIKLPAPKN
jgi:protein-disulfide isomerase